jgi:hypothetical protein
MNQISRDRLVVGFSLATMYEAQNLVTRYQKRKSKKAITTIATSATLIYAVKRTIDGYENSFQF